jgi:hypothetical protein
MRSSTWSGFGQGADPVSSLRCGFECPQAASAAIPISSNPGRRTWPSIHPRLHQVDTREPPARPSTSEHTSPLRCVHALVAEGVGAAVVWGLVPTFRAGALHAPQRVGLSLLSANADLVRAHLASALRDPGQLVTLAGTVALTVSASLLVTFSGPRTHDRPERVPVRAPTVERAQQHPVVAPSPLARTPEQGPSRNEGELGDRRDPNRRESTDPGPRADQEESQGEAEDNKDQGQNQNNADQGENEDNNDQGENEDDADQGRDNAQRGESQDNNDQGDKQDDADQDENQDGRKPEAPGSSMAFGVAPLGPREARGT